ncbi:MAG: chitinase, partial [Myxococcaceae bacterium]|nr:chitinase [Myxococcaceae bacterium]
SQTALRYQDFTNLMAYDYHGTWNDVVGPNAPLYDDGKDGELSDLYNTPEYQKVGYFNTDWAFHYLRGALQAGRINIGIPYYTRGWKNVSGGQNGLWGTSGATDCQPGTGTKRPCGGGASGIDNIWHDQTGNGGELSAGISPMWHAKNLEKNILPAYADHVGLTPATNPDHRLSGTYVREWDPITRTSWLWNETKKTFLSTEDEGGVDAIVDYVKASGAGGVMMWELSGDYQCPPDARPESPCVMGYTLTTRLSEQLAGSAPYGELRSQGSSAQLPPTALDVKVELAKYPSDAAHLWPLTPVVRITNNTDVTLGGGKNTTLSFDLPTSTSSLIKDGNWQTGEQAGQWRITPGHTGPNAGVGLRGNFHRITTTLEYCQIIPPRGSLELPIIYYLPATGPVNALLDLGGHAFSTAGEQLRGAGLVTPPAGGCSAAEWNVTKIYDPATQPIEETTIRYQGKVWRAKWWTLGNIPGSGADADHEAWKLIGPG